MSRLSSPPRWTPPMPPVANTRMPARCAAIIVAETVVPAQPGRPSCADRFWRATLAGFTRLRQVLELGIVQADQDGAVVHGDRGGHGPVGADGGLRAAGGIDVGGVRQAVGDEGRIRGRRRPGRPRARRRPRGRCEAGRWACSEGSAAGPLRQSSVSLALPLPRHDGEFTGVRTFWAGAEIQDAPRAARTAVADPGLGARAAVIGDEQGIAVIARPGRAAPASPSGSMSASGRVLSGVPRVTQSSLPAAPGPAVTTNARPLRRRAPRPAQARPGHHRSAGCRPSVPSEVQSRPPSSPSVALTIANVRDTAARPVTVAGRPSEAGESAVTAAEAGESSATGDPGHRCRPRRSATAERPCR